VLFTDEPARAARLQGLATQQRRLGAQQAELQGRVDEKAAVRAVAATYLLGNGAVVLTANASPLWMPAVPQDGTGVMK